MAPFWDLEGFHMLSSPLILATCQNVNSWQLKRVSAASFATSTATGGGCERRLHRRWSVSCILVSSSPWQGVTRPMFKDLVARDERGRAQKRNSLNEKCKE